MQDISGTIGLLISLDLPPQAQLCETGLARSQVSANVPHGTTIGYG
jgi:hypothetical protein